MIKNSRIDINNFYSGVCGEDIFRKIYKEYEARLRGSRPEIMLNFEKDFPGAKRILLDVNYRCGKYIVETSKILFRTIKERFDKTITAASESCEPVSYITFENRRDENMYLIKDIKELVGNGRCFKRIRSTFQNKYTGKITYRTAYVIQYPI